MRELQVHESVNPEDLGRLNLLLLREEGFKFDFRDDNYIANGSWGDVWILRNGELARALDQVFPDHILGPGVAIKFPRRAEDGGELKDGFVRYGSLAEACLDEEVAAGLKQLAVGLPPVLKALWAQVVSGRIYFSLGKPDETAEKVVVMPWFDKTLAEALEEGGIDSRQADVVMQNLMARLGVMFEPATRGRDIKLGQMQGVKGLIIDPRMESYAQGLGIWEDYHFRDVAAYVNRRISDWLGEFSEVIEARLKEGKFGAQHGDGRPVNVFLVEKGNGQVLTALPDAVRLARYSDTAVQGRVMKEWYMTDVLLQGGVALGKLLALEENDWFKAGVEAFAKEFDEDVYKNVEIGELFGIGLAYGISIEIHVLGYQWKAAVEAGQWNKVGQINDELKRYWEAMKTLADNPLSWRRVFRGGR